MEIVPGIYVDPAVRFGKPCVFEPTQSVVSREGEPGWSVALRRFEHEYETHGDWPRFVAALPMDTVRVIVRRRLVVQQASP